MTLQMPKEHNEQQEECSDIDKILIPPRRPTPNIPKIFLPYPPKITAHEIITRITKAKSKNNTAKPPNQFLIYRQLYVGELIKLNIQCPMTDISKIIADRWKEEPKYVRDAYLKISIEANRLHKQMLEHHPKQREDKKGEELPGTEKPLVSSKRQLIPNIPRILLPYPPKITAQEIITRITKAKSKDNTAKPPNQFLIYRQVYVRELINLGVQVNMTEISKTIADRWKEEPKIVRDAYLKISNEAIQLHKQIFGVPTSKKRNHNKIKSSKSGHRYTTSIFRI